MDSFPFWRAARHWSARSDSESPNESTTAWSAWIISSLIGSPRYVRFDLKIGLCVVLIFSWVYRLIGIVVFAVTQLMRSRVSCKPLGGGNDYSVLFCLVLFSCVLIAVAFCFAFIDKQFTFLLFLAGECLSIHPVNLTNRPSARLRNAIGCGDGVFKPFGIT